MEKSFSATRLCSKACERLSELIRGWMLKSAADI